MASKFLPRCKILKECLKLHQKDIYCCNNSMTKIGKELKGFLYKYWSDATEIIQGGFSGNTLQNVKVFTNSWPDVSTVLLTYKEGSETCAFAFSTDYSKAAPILSSSEHLSDLTLGHVCIKNVEKVEDSLCETLKATRLDAVKYIYTAGTRSHHSKIILPSNLRKNRIILPSNLRLDAIHSSDIDFVVSKWSLTKKSDKAKRLMKHFITSYPNAAVYDTSVEPAQLVSWVTSSGLGVLYHLYAVEEYRGKGLAKVVVEEISRKILGKGIIPIAYIVIGNEASQNVLEKCGYTKTLTEGQTFYV